MSFNSRLFKHQNELLIFKFYTNNLHYFIIRRKTSTVNSNNRFKTSDILNTKHKGTLKILEKILYFNVSTAHFVQFIMQTNKCTTYILTIF